MHWFAEVVRWRSVASAVWLLLLATPALLMFQLLVSCDPLHPLSWAAGAASAFLSLRGCYATWVSLSSLMLLFVVYSYTYTVKLPVFKCRLEVLLAVLRPGHLLAILAFSLAGAGGGCGLAEAAGYSRVWEPCGGLERCFNEHLFFCILYGWFSGLCYGVCYYVHKDDLLVFPSIQQRKLFRLRGHLSSHVTEALLWTLKCLRVFYPLYFFCGGYARFSVTSKLSLHLNPAVPELTSLAGLVDVRLLLHLVLAGTLLHVCWSFGLRLFRTFQTEAVCFPVVATFSGETSRLLVTALQTSTRPLLLHLAYQDLSRLALHSSQRRRQSYSLDQEGRPAVWDQIAEECIARIASLTARLGGKSTSGHVTPPPAVNFATNDVTLKGWPSPSYKPLSSPGATRRGVAYEKARLWSYSPGVEGVPPAYSPAAPEPPKKPAKLKQLHTALKALPGRLKEKLKRKPFFIHFLSEFPEAASQETYADCRLQVWAVLSLSQLAAASYTEDSYGVVQRTLPRILSTLIDLAQVMDRHVKAPLSSSASTRNVRVAMETNGKYAVKTAVQTGLHRLATTFSKERRSLQLSTDHAAYWLSLSKQ